MDKSKTFSEQLEKTIRTLSGTDFSLLADILGGQFKDSTLWLDFFNRFIGVRPPSFIDRDSVPVNDAVKTVLLTYIQMHPQSPEKETGNLVSFREFDGAGPLISRFTANTAKIIETSFTGNIEILRDRCISLGGRIADLEGYDLAIRFMGLPRLPIFFFFNETEDGLPASASFLFDETAPVWVDNQGLMLMITYLTGCLIANT